MVAAMVMLIVGFFFATVSGNLVGVIGSSNNPVSGLTLSTLIIAALLMVALGVSGPGGVAVVLGVAAVVCVSSAVAGELLQDFKAGYILGGTPRAIQIVELIAVVVASLVMYYPLYVLQQANIKSGGTGFGDPKPGGSAGGIDGGAGARDRRRGDGVAAGGRRRAVRRVADHVQSDEPDAGGRRHVSAVPDHAARFSWAAFCAGSRTRAAARGNNEAQRTRVENIGILIASGLIAGEALTGLAVRVFQVQRHSRFVSSSKTVVSGRIRGHGDARLGSWCSHAARRKPAAPEDPAPPAAMM